MSRLCRFQILVIVEMFVYYRCNVLVRMLLV